MFLNRLRASAVGQDRSPFGSFWFEPVGMATSSGTRVTPAAAMLLPSVFACVRVLAESFACMPFTLYAPKFGGGRAQTRSHWLHRLLAKAPNQFQTPFEFRLMLQGHLSLRGNAFCEIHANQRGEITDLIPLHPDRVQAEMLPNGSYRYRYTDPAGAMRYYARGEIWHLRSMSTDGIVGMSPIECAREAIGEGLALQSYASRFFANDAKPGGWVEIPGTFTSDDARKEFKDKWHQNYATTNKHKIAVLDKGMKFHELALNNADAQFIESRAAKVTEVARIFRVPPHKIADLHRSTNNNIEQQAIEFWTDTMLPIAELWESSIESFLLGADTDFEVEFDMRRLMRGDAASRSAYYQSGINTGWMVRNEARAEEGLDPLPGLDEPLRPLNMVEESAASDEVAEDDGGEDDTAAAATRPEPAEARRLQAIVSSSAQRLARRAAGALARKPAAEVFDADFAGLLAEALGVTAERADIWCAWLRTTNGLTADQITRHLMDCAAIASKD